MFIALHIFTLSILKSLYIYYYFGGLWVVSLELGKVFSSDNGVSVSIM